MKWRVSTLLFLLTFLFPSDIINIINIILYVEVKRVIVTITDKQGISTKYMYEFPSVKLKAELKMICALKGISMRDYITQAIEEKLSREEIE